MKVHAEEALKDEDSPTTPEGDLTRPCPAVVIQEGYPQPFVKKRRDSRTRLGLDNESRRQRRSSYSSDMQEPMSTETQAPKTKKSGNKLNKRSAVQGYLDTRPEDESAVWRWKLAHLMSHTLIKVALVIAITANAVLVGVAADYGNSTLVDGLEAMFLTLFTLELILNLIGFGRLYFNDLWNRFDAFIIVVALIDGFVAIFSDGNGSAVSVFRLIRILRIFRLASFLDELFFLLKIFLKGMKSTFWVGILWTLSIYIFAVLAKGFFGDSESLKEKLRGRVDIDEHFGTIPRSMVTLIAFFTYDDANSIQRAIGQEEPAAWIFFLAYMVLVSIGMMELMTSLFINSLLEEKDRRDNNSRKEKDSKRAEVQDFLKGLFDAFDSDNNELLDKAELESCLTVFDDPDTLEMLDYVEIDSKKVQEAISVADIDGDDGVSADEFIAALESTHKEPKMSDIRHLHQKLARIQTGVNNQRQESLHQYSSLTSRLDRIEKLLEQVSTQQVGLQNVSPPAE